MVISFRYPKGAVSDTHACCLAWIGLNRVPFRDQIIEFEAVGLKTSDPSKIKIYQSFSALETKTSRNSVFNSRFRLEN